MVSSSCFTSPLPTTPDVARHICERAVKRKANRAVCIPARGFPLPVLFNTTPAPLAKKIRLPPLEPKASILSNPRSTEQPLPALPLLGKNIEGTDDGALWRPLWPHAPVISTLSPMACAVKPPRVPRPRRHCCSMPARGILKEDTVSFTGTHRHSERFAPRHRHHVSFALDCKKPKPTSLLEMLSLYGDISDQFTEDSNSPDTV